jgi:DNA-binding NarL/FixJ family response regulator
MGEPVRVTVVATDPVLEAGVTSALLGCPDLAVATPGDTSQVTVVVVDGVGSEALDLVRAARTGRHGPEVVLVATDLVLGEAMQAIAAGARGLLRRREADPDRLARTVLAAAGGDCMVPPDMLGRLLEHTEAASAEPGPWTGPGLSQRERAVLELIADGRETDDIARELCYSTRTVTSVVHDITHRFQLRNRAHAVAFAVRSGLL